MKETKLIFLPVIYNQWTLFSTALVQVILLYGGLTAVIYHHNIHLNTGGK